MRCKECGNTEYFLYSFDARVTIPVTLGVWVNDPTYLRFDDDDPQWMCRECGSDRIDDEAH